MAIDAYMRDLFSTARACRGLAFAALVNTREQAVGWSGGYAPLLSALHFSPAVVFPRRPSSCDGQ